MMTGSQRLCSHCGGRLFGGDRFCAHCGAPQEDAAPDLADPATAAAWDAVLEELRGVTAGKYEVGRMLGAGGMAAVFLGREIKLPRRVAIKVMSPSLMLAPGMLDRFRREAATMAALNHPNIVTIYTVEETARLQYFVMKYVGGPSLEGVIHKHGRLPAPVATAWLTQVASALGYAHRRGVIHRDIKPGNILLDEEGTAVVTDFGIAKVLRDRSLTQVGATVGTPAYMSPEQCLSREVTAAADQYSLGIVAYEMLTGEPPFTGPSLEVMQAHVQQRPPPIAVSRPDCPGELQAAIARMLAKDPDERWPSMEDAIVAMGGRPIGHDDPLRFQLADLAGGRPPSLVMPVPTPRSPVPVPRSPVPTPRSPVPLAPAGIPAPPVRVAAVEVSPTARAVGVGRRARLRAVVRGSDGTPLPDRPVRWMSSDPIVAAVSDDGVIEAHELGTVTVTAECDGLTGAATVEVTEGGLVATLGRFWWVGLAAVVAVAGVWAFVASRERGPRPPPVASVAVFPPRASVSVGGTLELTPSVKNAAQRELTGIPLRWSSSDPGVATVSDAGVVTALSSGEATITAATGEGRAGSAVVVVTSTRAIVGAVVVNPERREVEPGERFRLAATVLDAEGGVLGGRLITWSTSDSTIAAVSAGGDVTAVAPGTAVIAAASEDRRGTAQVVVTSARVARVTLDRRSVSAEVSASFQLAATVADARGQPLRQRLVTWESANPQIATVAPDGTVRALALGTTEIIARSEEQSARATVTVIPRGGATVRVELERTTVRVGDSVRAEGRVIEGGGAISWSVSDTAIARISPAGVVYGKAAGTVAVIARSRGGQGSATLTVIAPGVGLQVVSAGGRHTCGLTAGSDVLCWGQNDRGQVVAGAPSPSLVPTRTPRTGYVTIGAGAAHSCGITRTGALQCWGNSDDGRLGASLIGEYRAVAPGGKHTCALWRDRTVSCWGSNARGQLGNGSQESSREPRAVAIKEQFDSVVAGGEHSCGLTGGGTVYCWGSNWAGAVGSGQLPNSVRLPARAAIGRVQALTAGESHTCALAAGGLVYCWGGNGSGQVGDGTTEDRFRPVAILPTMRFAAVSAGGAHTCAITTGGQAYCWGRNDGGQLGTGGRTDNLRPVPVPGAARFRSISAGGAHTCGVTVTGETLCWGANQQGQVGDGSTTSRLVPAPTRAPG